MTAAMVKARKSVAKVARALGSSGLDVGDSGNVSVRLDDGRIAITPNGVSLRDFQTEDVSVVRADGTHQMGPPPSFETSLHVACYEGRDMSAIVHAHPRFATTLSALVKEVPAIHHEMADLGWPLRVAEYGRFGSQQLADQTVAALGDRNAVLMKNHGMVAVAGDAGAALGRALATEWVCEVFYRALLVGEPALLPEGELAAVSEERSAAEGGGPGFPFDTSYLDKAGWR